MVKWAHRLPKQSKAVKLDESSRTDRRGGTSCFIYELNGTEKTPVCEVHLNRYYKDTFSKEAGRKYSLTKALRDCKFSRSERKAFWESYLGRKEEEAVYNVGE